MQYLVIGRDYKDKAALARRLKARPAHLELGESLRQNGSLWYGAAIWDTHNQMTGSILIVDFSSEKALHDWLDVEPYVTEKVWESVEIEKCNVRSPWQFNRPKKWFESRKNLTS